MSPALPCLFSFNGVTSVQIQNGNRLAMIGCCVGNTISDMTNVEIKLVSVNVYQSSQETPPNGRRREGEKENARYSIVHCQHRLPRQT